jgi:hypothetical protein
VALLPAFAAPAPALAQSRITTDVDTTRVTVGDRITLSVTVEHPSSSSVTWPDSFDLTPFEVLDASAPSPEAAADAVRSRLVLTLAAFELGELEVPSLDVVVTASDGTQEALSSRPVGIEVVSVGTDESGDIRDIRGPLEIPLGALRLALWVILPLLVAALLFVVARRLRTREVEEVPASSGLPPRPAHEVALEALAELEASPMLARGQVKEYHIEAADILRTYAGARFAVDALEMTTHEVLDALAAKGVDARLREGIGAFLDQCDLVKFAKVRPGLDASRELLDLGRRLVLDSAPSPEPSAPEASAGEAPATVAPVASAAGGRA